MLSFTIAFPNPVTLQSVKLAFILTGPVAVNNRTSGKIIGSILEGRSNPLIPSAKLLNKPAIDSVEHLLKSASLSENLHVFRNSAVLFKISQFINFTKNIKNHKRFVSKYSAE